MCGIAGIVNAHDGAPPEEADLWRMLGMIRHRGPDEFGLYCDEHAALGSARLSIIDLSGGQQPISNEDDSLWIVFNGEIFNYVELRAELQERGHRFKTQTDTEVILHLYEEVGVRCLQRLNGQFAMAIWDNRQRTLFLARDRLGVRPLFYARSRDTLLFGSEVKALLAEGRLAAEIDPAVLRQIFTFWSPLSSRTVFRGIFEVPPGHYLVASKGNIEVIRYWEIDFVSEKVGTVYDHTLGGAEENLAEELVSLLTDAARLRLRADVPVGGYLSGGLDSSIIASIARKLAGNAFNTFSITFDDKKFDESQHQLLMARFLGTKHHVVHAAHADIGRVFPEVIWHAETALMRTAPAPMFLLSKLVRDSNFKVVLTGEGADEFLLGYDIFKETKIRRFWSTQPNSKWRSGLLARVYPQIAGLAGKDGRLLASFFGHGLTDVDNPFYSHLIRWRNNRRTCRFFSDQVSQQGVSDLEQSLGDVELPAEFSQWDPIQRAQYLEISIFMSQYLLSAQGDRMAMAHSVEGRFPFLDYRVVEFCNRLPTRFKLRGLNEKYLLKKAAQRLLPPEVLQRTKRAYRAPIYRSFYHENTPDYVDELLSSKQIKRAGLFQSSAVEQLVTKAKQGKIVGETDEMALAGIISSQLLHFQFVEDFPSAPSISESNRAKVCIRRREAVLN